jgi:tetratricopeptide (TPR) repeat protein/KaiC/GvpD/RAD55 family RecA-like ATPase
MSQRRSSLRVLAKAKESEKKYDWLQAIESYNEAQTSVLKQKSFQKAGEIQEKIGFCSQNAAMQAESREEFREKMRYSIEAYEKASGFYEMPLNNQAAARKLRCDAIAKYLGYWLTSDSSEKRKLLDECLELESEALARFSESEDYFEYGKTYNELQLVFFHRVFLEKDRNTLIRVLEKGMRWGKKAIAGLSEVGNAHETAKAQLTLATCLSDDGFYFASKSEDIDTNRSAAVKHLNEAVRLCEKVGDANLLGLSHLWLGINTGEEEAASHHEKALEYGKQTRNNFLVAKSLDYLSYNTYWKALATEDPEKRKELAEEAMRFYRKAHRHYHTLSHISTRGGFIGPPSGQAEHYHRLALWEPSPEKRRKLLAKSEKLGIKALKVAEDSNMPMVIAQVLHVVSKTLQAQANIESDPQKKKSHLQKALKCRERTIEIFSNLTPFFYWNLGVMQNYLAGIEAQLAEIEPDLNRKKDLLEKAALSKKKCLQLCKKVMPYFEKKGEIDLFAALQNYQDRYATMQMRLYNITGKPEHLRKAINVLQEAVESAGKLDMVSLIAESHWKIAKSQGALREHLKAAKNFKNASKIYIKASEKIPQLKEFYQDHAFYMQAWSEIEKARHHHANKQYGQAKKNYEKAANLHQSTKRWNHFSRNYLAWARLEEAEALSRAEQNQEATQQFKKAAKLFREAKSTLKAAVDGIENADEKDLANRLIKALAIREEYCLGRTILEEAKTLGRQGDNAASSSNYGLAAEKFQEVLDIIEHEPSFSKETKAKDRQELMPILYLCKAWEMMAKAEAEASPGFYLEASRLFNEAKDHSVNQEARLLAIGHSHFCRALEAGTRFEDSGDKRLYLSATRHMQSAANYYLRAGLKTASEYATATQHFFDAYVYMTNAKKEADPQKKARYYIVAEKLLQASIESYLKAKHSAKSRHVQQLLEKVKEERELAMSLSKILHDPTITSSTTSFVTPTPSEESAVGLERFEHANIQATLITPKRQISVGKEANLKIQITNVGKQTVLLDKVEEILPRGFEVVAKPSYSHIEDEHLEMKGKRLDPLKTEEIRLAMMAFDDGTFVVKPKIIYVDTDGHQMVSELEQGFIEVSKVVLMDRVTTGYQHLDNLLLGGIPKNYAIILTSPSCDERDLLISSFIKAGAKEEQTTFNVTTKAAGTQNLKGKFQSNLYLFICNPQADEITKNQANVFKLKGVENLTELNIALISALRKLSTPLKAPRRCCIQIISDVLLHHKALQTRRWLSGLLTELRSKGFIILAVMDPKMHSLQEVRAVLDLFDGEISIYVKEDNSRIRRFLRIQRMTDQEYLDSELPLSKINPRRAYKEAQTTNN